MRARIAQFACLVAFAVTIAAASPTPRNDEQAGTVATDDSSTVRPTLLAQGRCYNGRCY